MSESDIFAVVFLVVFVYQLSTCFFQWEVVVICHLVGPVYVFCWLLFPAKTTAGPAMASSIVIVLTCMFLIVGSGYMKFDLLTNTVSRSGSRRELLLGPASYGMIHILATFLFWRDSPAGIASILILCAGSCIHWSNTYRMIVCFVPHCRHPFTNARAIRGCRNMVKYPECITENRRNFQNILGPDVDMTRKKQQDAVLIQSKISYKLLPGD